MLLLMLVGSVGAQQVGDVVILYDNDVHCAIEGYPVLAALRDSLRQRGCEVSIVSAGDFVAGSTLGSASQGEAIVRVMNVVGYDAVCVGNHEFDYGISQLQYLQQRLSAPLLSCNFRCDNGEESVRPFTPYTFRDCADLHIAYIGVTTPTTIYTASPGIFRDGRGNLSCDFDADGLIAVVQQVVDEVRQAGADRVVLLSHLGDTDSDPTSVTLANHTEGVDLIIDAHDHHVIPYRQVLNRRGLPVVLTSSGAHFHNIGMVVLTTETDAAQCVTYTRLLPVDSLARAGYKDMAVRDTLRLLDSLYNKNSQRVVGNTLYSLVAEVDDIQVVRLQETNLGDLVADAFRAGLQTDIGWANGGALRANIAAGSIHYDQLAHAYPFTNRMCVIRVTGQSLLDALEMTVRDYPKAKGCYPQVSGISFDLDTAIPSCVVINSQGYGVCRPGLRRVSNVRVGTLPLRPEASYTIAGSEYVLLQGGDAIHFADKEIISVTDTTDLQLIERYITDCLGGTVSTPYDKPQGRINMKR